MRSTDEGEKSSEHFEFLSAESHAQRVFGALGSGGLKKKNRGGRSSWPGQWGRLPPSQVQAGSRSDA
jgi:hypothetical protein